MQKKVLALIKGYVQGVGFRSWAYRKANMLGLSGYIRNLPNGDVEVLASGDKLKVDEFVEMLQAGPPGAEVEEVKIQELSGEAIIDGFHIRYD